MTSIPPPPPGPDDALDAGTPEEHVRRILEAADAAAPADLQEAIQAARDQALADAEGPAADAAVVATLRAARDAGRDPSDALYDALGVLPRPWPLAEASAAEPGERVLWAGGDAGGDLLGVGEVGVLAGAGGLGKSTIALDMMMCAEAAARCGVQSVELGCGLWVVAGPVVLAGYEDSPARVGERARSIADALARGHTIALSPGASADVQRRADAHIGDILAGAEPWGDGGGPLYQPLSMSLFAPPPDYPSAPLGPTAAYHALLERTEREAAHLLIVDPVTAAFAGNANDGSSVRQFIARLTVDAGRLGIAILLLAHSTKAGRRGPALDPMQRGAEAIAGSGQWFDAPRAVLLFEPEPSASDEDAQTARQRMASRRVLIVSKTNYGESGWERNLGIRRTLHAAPGRRGDYAGWAIAATPADEAF